MDPRSEPPILRFFPIAVILDTKTSPILLCCTLSFYDPLIEIVLLHCLKHFLSLSNTQKAPRESLSSFSLLFPKYISQCRLATNINQIFNQRVREYGVIGVSGGPFITVVI